MMLQPPFKSSPTQAPAIIAEPAAARPCATTSSTSLLLIIILVAMIASPEDMEKRPNLSKKSAGIISYSKLVFKIVLMEIL
jgi:hypothetical protein